LTQNKQLDPSVRSSWRSPYDLVCTGLAVILGCAIGRLDLRATEVCVTMMALLVAGLLLGALQPRAAWRWALLIAAGLPSMATIALLSGERTAEPVRLDVRVALVATVIALIGSTMGVVARRAAHALTSRSR